MSTFKQRGVLKNEAEQLTEPIVEAKSIKATRSGTRICRQEIDVNPHILSETLRPNKHDAVWSKVLIYHNNVFSKEEIFEEVFPVLFDKVHFYPCCYKRYPKRDEFYLYKNYDALKALAENNLQASVPKLHKKVLVFGLLLDMADYEEGHPYWYKKLAAELSTKRIVGNTLNLNEMKYDPEFWNMAVPLNLSYNFQFIVDMARKQNPRLDTILAQKNSIRSLDGQFLAFPSLTKLDFRHNQIFDLNGMCETTAVTEVLLDGNPLCLAFKDSKAMISAIKSHFSNLEWLDGCRVEGLMDLITFQNFIVDSNKCSLFAHEFVKDFFTLYDSFERKKLLQLYKAHSVFTVSTYYDVDKSDFISQAIKQLSNYTKLSRNLKMMSDFSKAKENFYYGIKAIGQVFEHLPQTSHDCTNFCIDVPVITQEQVMITVTGAFEEKNSIFQLSFTRTFILQLNETYQYTITNDQLLIRKPTLKQKDNFTPQTKMLTQEKVELLCTDLFPNESEEKKLKLVIFAELTGLEQEQAIKKLQKCHWDLKVALVLVSNMME